MRELLRKLIIAVPLLVLAFLIGLIISVNVEDTDSPVVREEVKEKEPEVSEVSKQNPANPKAKGFQPSEFGEPKDMVLAIHEE
ncbi:hypothetical protein [Planococcus shixiaomingii]|uniref:hypothetical protein n=1 Tax=Planococcus shixiaomingii TaxID=3058393 RepID=UPI0026598C6A|nr:hypothetical protein [Planococcus sp. N028]